MKLTNQVYVKLESKGYPKLSAQPDEAMSVNDALRFTIQWLMTATMNRKVVIQFATSPEHFDDKRGQSGGQTNVDDLMAELLDGIVDGEHCEP
jgi:hypothetical protein